MKSEAVVQQEVRLALARMGGQVWRNNTGACTDESGRLIRYGLANESAQLNAVIKSSDLIGIVPVTITADMVGKTVGVFVAVECKHEGWHMIPSDNRAKAQAKYIDIVKDVGGMGGFATCVEDLNGILKL